VCPGTPGSADDCRYLDGAWTKYPLRVTASDGTSWDPAAYSNAMNSVSTGLQMFVFIALSGLADFGRHRKSVFMGISLVGCMLSILCLTIRPASWQWAGALVVLTSVCYMSTYVFYNAWLPLLGANDPAVLAAPKEKQDDVFMSRMHDISSRGFAFGYLGSVICLLICVGVTVVLSDDSIVAYGVNCAIAGVWWFVFSLPTFAWLKPRPGPPLPKGTNYLTLPWKRLAVTFSRVKQLPQTFLFLVCWFMYSDGFNVISSVGAIYANTSVTWIGLPKSIGLAALLVIVPIFAGIGNLFFNFIHRKGWLQPKTIIRINLVGMALVPAYGLLGFADKSLGYRRFWEL
jgi:UMF1 family MFS transporter